MAENTLTAAWAGMKALRYLSISEIISIYFFHFMFYILLTFVSISENPAENHENPGLTGAQGPQNRGRHNKTGIAGSSEGRSNLTLSYQTSPLSPSYTHHPQTQARNPELTGGDEGDSHQAQNSLDIHDESSRPNQNKRATAGGKKREKGNAKCVNLPLRAAAEVQISSLQSK